MPNVTLPMLPSCCTICDSQERCEHTNAARYLEGITYEREEGGGFTVPEFERARCDSPVKGVTPRPPGYHEEFHAKELAELVSDLEEWVLLDDRLQRQLAEAHDRSPRRATKLVAQLMAAANAGQLRSPAGLLATMLHEDAQVKRRGDAR